MPRHVTHEPHASPVPGLDAGVVAAGEDHAIGHGQAQHGPGVALGDAHAALRWDVPSTQRTVRARCGQGVRKGGEWSEWHDGERLLCLAPHAPPSLTRDHRLPRAFYCPHDFLVSQYYLVHHPDPRCPRLRTPVCPAPRALLRHQRAQILPLETLRHARRHLHPVLPAPLLNCDAQGVVGRQLQVTQVLPGGGTGPEEAHAESESVLSFDFLSKWDAKRTERHPPRPLTGVPASATA